MVVGTALGTLTTGTKTTTSTRLHSVEVPNVWHVWPTCAPFLYQVTLVDGDVTKNAGPSLAVDGDVTKTNAGP